MSDNPLDRAVPNGAGGVYLVPDPAKVPEPFEPPGCDFEDPAQLEAWYGNFGFFEHFRKIVLANCRAIIRAKASAGGKKITVDQCDDEARQHPNYVGFVEEHLHGRILREKNVLASFGR